MNRLPLILLLTALPLSLTLAVPRLFPQASGGPVPAASTPLPAVPLVSDIARTIERSVKLAQAHQRATATLHSALTAASETASRAGDPLAPHRTIRQAALHQCPDASRDAALLLRAGHNTTDQRRLLDMRAHCGFRHDTLTPEAIIEAVDAARALSATNDDDPGAQLLAPWRALWAAHAAMATEDHDRAREESLAGRAALPPFRLALELELIGLRAELRLADHATSAVRRAGAFLDQWPETPTADLLRLEIVDALIMLERPDDAARAAEHFLHVRPQVLIASAFQLRLDDLSSGDISLPSRSWEERFERARDVRFSRFRDLAEELLDELETEATDRGRHSDANRVRYQRVLNAWEGGRSEDGLQHIEAIRRHNYAGVSERWVEHYARRLLGRLGRGDEGIAILEESLSRRPDVERAREIEEYASMVGHWERALASARVWRADRFWNTFEAAFLLHFAGEHAAARDAFGDIAGRTTGATRRRAMYWQGRAATALGRLDQAASIFASIADSDAFDYHVNVARARLEELPTADLPPPLDGPPPATPPSSPSPNDSTDGVSWITTITDEAARHAHSFESPVAPDEPALLGHILSSWPLPDRDAASLRTATDAPTAMAAAAGASEGEPRRVHETPFARPGRRNLPSDPSPIGFARLLDDGQPGPVMQRLLDYAAGPEGALEAFVERWEHLFPSASTALALLQVGAREEARLIMRDVAEEFRALSVAGRSRPRPLRQPIELSTPLHAHRIDNRPQTRGWWGGNLETLRWPVPPSGQARERLRERQEAILAERSRIREDLREALAETGDAHLVRRFALEDGGLHGTPPTVDNIERWRAAYPPAHAEILLPAARRYDLDPFLLWALMVVESDLNPDSISRADAYGLMQVIPRTGDLTAAARGEIGFGIHALIDPSRSIDAGTWYFAQLMEKFSHQESLALVSYNAGPHQMARWIDWRGDGLALDEILETVPFDRARRYSERILRLAWLYRAIWDDDHAESLGNVLDTAYRDNIDW